MATQTNSEKIFINEAPQPLSEKQLARLKFSLEVTSLIIIIIVAFLLRFINLGNSTISEDEAFEANIIINLRFFDALTYHDETYNKPPLFYILMVIWVKLFGGSELALRLFSMFVGIITIPAVYLLIRRWLNQPIAILTALFMAISPLHVYFSREARHYSLFLLEAVISIGFLLLAVEKPNQNWRWFLHAVSVVVMLYTDYLSFYLIIAQGLFIVFCLYKNQKELVKGLISLAFAVLVFLPWFGNFIQIFQNKLPSGLIRPRPEQLGEVLYGFSSFYLPVNVYFLIGLIFIPLWIKGLVWMWQTYRQVAFLLAVWGILPIFLGWLGSLVVPNFLSSSFLFCLPPFLSLVVAGLLSFATTQSRSKLTLSFMASLISIIFVLNFFSLQNYTENYNPVNWREITGYISANCKEGDLLYIAHPKVGWGNIVRYYYNRQSNRLCNMPIESVPGEYYKLMISGENSAELPAPSEAVSKTFSNYRRVWLLRQHSTTEFNWVYKNIIEKVPSSFQATYYKEHFSPVQPTIALTLYQLK